LLQAQRVESIGTLAGGIAHDFNNLLGIIAGHSALLEENSGSPLARSASIGAINKAVERGANLVQQILTFARKTDVTVQPISIPDLVKDLFSLLRETFPRVISFATQFQDDLPPVSGDYSQVHQVLLNLCVNARDAMPGGGTLTISAHRACGDEMKAQFATAEAREYVRISVTDTGMGLDESVRKRIFDPFFTTKEKGKGTGLGLAVVYGVTQTHKGFIDVDSTIGKGSTFHIFLPSSTAAAHPPPLAARGTPSKPGRSETILVVEDEELLSSMLRSMLELNGYSVLVAKDGEEAIDLYEKQSETIDLVLTDLGLPGVGGDTVFRTLRKMNPRARVVLASGFVEPDVKNALMAEGVKEFIQKPYTPQSIIQCIRAILDTQ
jgi:CheY-like chemotaxis protein